MSNLTNFNNFELSTEESTNVEGGRCGSRRRRRSSNNCYSSYSSYNNCYSNNDCYSSYYSNNCEPAAEVEAAPAVEEPIIEVVAAPVPPKTFSGLAGA